MMNPVIFREYDIRGVVGKDFDEDFAYDLGRTYVTFISERTGNKTPTLSIGYDARLSSP